MIKKKKRRRNSIHRADMGRSMLRPYMIEMCGLLGSWVVAADEFLVVAIAFVFEFVVDADAGGVVAEYGQLLQLFVEADFDEIGHVVVVGEDGEDGDAIFEAAVEKSFAGVVLAHGVDETKTFAPEFFLVVVAAFADVLVDEVGDLGVFGAAGVAVFGDDGLAEFVDE